MCGIAGFVSDRTAPEDREAAVDRMCAAMVHRGPDDAGRTSVGQATLGVRRLAVFDPARGRQPMQTPDGRHTLVFNGAVYNFRDLRRELEPAFTFRTDCDTEVVLAAWARWGLASLAHLRGMYAIAVWDAQDASLTLARDPFGIKPLYWRRHDKTFSFASELNALIAAGTRPEIELNTLHAALARLAVPAPATIYRGIFSLRPAEWLTWRDGTIRQGTHWRFPAAGTEPEKTKRSDFHHELRHHLEQTVAAHQVADVPVGAFLSGGLDSAAILGLMARHATGPLRTFSIDFDEPGFSEAAEARASARHFGTQHHEITITADDAASALDGFIAALDQPTGDAFNTYLVARAARSGGVTVALSGLGGDELFGGYPSFNYVPRLARLLPWWRRMPGSFQAWIAHRLRRGNARQRKLADVLIGAQSIHDVAVLQRRAVDDTQRLELLAVPPKPEAFHPELDRLPQELEGAYPQRIVSAWELRSYMTDVLLRDSDTMSMAHSLELRVPFIDVPLVEWLWRQPAEFVFTPGNPKSALATALRDLLPPGVASRQKRGFTLPFPQWMRSTLRPFLDDTFARESITRSGYFQPDAVEEMWHRYLNGHDTRSWSRVWMTAVLIAFVNRRTCA